MVKLNHQLAVLIVAMLPRGCAADPGAIREQDLDRNAHLEAGRRHSAHCCGDVPVRVAGGYLKTGMVHVRDDGQLVGGGIRAGNLGDDVAKVVLLVPKANLSQDGLDRCGHAIFPEGCCRVAAQPGEEVEGLVFGVGHSAPKGKIEDVGSPGMAGL